MLLSVLAKKMMSENTRWDKGDTGNKRRVTMMTMIIYDDMIWWDVSMMTRWQCDKRQNTKNAKKPMVSYHFLKRTYNLNCKLHINLSLTKGKNTLKLDAASKARSPQSACVRSNYLQHRQHVEDLEGESWYDNDRFNMQSRRKKKTSCSPRGGARTQLWQTGKFVASNWQALHAMMGP